MIDASEIDWRVYPVVDPEQCVEGRGLLTTAELAVQAGAGVIQLRDKQSDDRQLVRRAKSLREICEREGAVFIVNDRIDAALAADADGVHLGPDDLAIADAVRIRQRAELSSDEFLIGASAGTPSVARRRVEAGADYLGVGAMYDAAPSKPDASEPRGPEGLARVRRQVDVPIVGIGGITPDNAPAVIEAGADGVAVIRAICQAEDVQQAVSALLDASG